MPYQEPDREYPIMLTKIRRHALKPILILTYSFLLGLLIDAVAETASAQDTSSRNVRYRRLVQEENDPAVDKDDNLQNDEQQIQDGSELSRPIMDIRLDVIEDSLRAPRDESYELQEMNYSSNYPGTFQNRIAVWCAPNIRYQPLYFQDVGLERYGYDYGDKVQPVASALHFAKSFTLLVPNMWYERPGSCAYPLGFCRPGSCAPQIKNRWLR